MYGFIFGFQRLVWWPKWTPASSSWRMVMPCAGVIACCMPVASAPAGGPACVGIGAFDSTVSDIIRFSPPPPSRQSGPMREPRPDREVCVVVRRNCGPLRNGSRKGRGDLTGTEGYSKSLSKWLSPSHAQHFAHGVPRFIPGQKVACRGDDRFLGRGVVEDGGAAHCVRSRHPARCAAAALRSPLCGGSNLTLQVPGGC